jgi:DNA-binding NtrC family response regulator
MIKTEIKSLKTLVGKIASSDGHVMIEGEIGTQSDKENIARQIHQTSKRQEKPFVIFSCGVLNERMEMEELFGKVPEIFIPGETILKLGLLEVANGGTLYLENVDKLSLQAQEKISLFLQTKTATRTNSGNLANPHKFTSDLRFITSTSVNLSEKICHGNFNEVLYYRLSMFNITIPPLRQRKEDIPSLVAKCLGTAQAVSPEALEILVNYKWLYNTEELNNVCEVLSNIPKDVIDVEDLPTSITNASEHLSIKYSPEVSLYDVEKQYIMKAITYFKGNKTQTAEALGITIKTLYNKLHEYGLYESK